MNLLSKLKRNRFANIFTIYLRYLIGGAFVFSAMPKIAGERFMTYSGEDEPINTLAHFFETIYRSGIYWNFIGWAQVIASLLLMTQVFSTAGAIIFFPIILNIFVLTVSYRFIGTPYITSLMLLANIFLLAWDYNKLKILFHTENGETTIIESGYNKYFSHKFWTYLGLLIFITTILYVIINGRNPLYWFLICVAEGLIGFIYISRKFSS